MRQTVFATELVRRMEQQARFLVVLDTQWGEDGLADRWFPINPRNWSGSRLYKLCGCCWPHVWVTNLSAQQVARPQQRGQADPTWLLENLRLLSPTLRQLPLLVCGQRPRRAYPGLCYQHAGPVFELKHPADRTWDRAELAAVHRQLTAPP